MQISRAVSKAYKQAFAAHSAIMLLLWLQLWLLVAESQLEHHNPRSPPLSTKICEGMQVKKYFNAIASTNVYQNPVELQIKNCSAVIQPLHHQHSFNLESCFIEPENNNSFLCQTGNMQIDLKIQMSYLASFFFPFNFFRP